MNVASIRPFLWFESGAEDAARFYVSVFDDASLGGGLDPRGDIFGEPAGASSVRFRLQGQEFIALNGGAQPGFSFSPAISFLVECETQAEVDHLWDSLSAGGKPRRCGWLEDKFGVTWQIVPSVLFALLNDDDRVAAGRAMQKMLTMTKLDIFALTAAHAGAATG